MSHIPASKMPHAKPHDDGDEDGKPLTDGPEVKPAAADKPAKAGKGGDHGTGAYLAIAGVGALAIGGIVAALALRRPEPPHKGGKRKPKSRPRKREAE